jgi:uncharacterized protein YrzB (UPF0473 family)
MNENDFEYEYYTLTDEEGNENEYELIGSVEMKGNKYFALIPIGDENESEFLEYVILKSQTQDDGEEILATIDDEDEYDDVADYFDDIFAEEIDHDA